MTGYESPGAIERYAFYEAANYPFAVFGGVRAMEQWNCNYPNFTDSYNDVIGRESPLLIELQFDFDGTNQFTISADIELEDNVSPDENKLMFLITNWIDYNDDHPWIFPVVAASDTINFPYDLQGQTANYQHTFTIDILPEWEITDFRAVAFIQSFATQEIIQAAQVQYQATSANAPLLTDFSNLGKNYPNPFNPETTIPYFLDKNERITAKIEIYNIKGKKIKTYHDLKTGNNAIIWNGTDTNGNVMSSGVYFYKLITNNNIQTNKMILIK